MVADRSLFDGAREFEGRTELLIHLPEQPVLLDKLLTVARFESFGYGNRLVHSILERAKEAFLNRSDHRSTKEARFLIFGDLYREPGDICLEL